MDWLSQLFGGSPMGAAQGFSAPPTLGASIAGGPSAYSAPIGPTPSGDAMGTPLPAPPAARPGGALLDALRGIKAPEAPQAQRVATPHAPAQRAIGSGNELVQLLMSLGIGPKDIPGGFRMPGRG